MNKSNDEIAKARRGRPPRADATDVRQTLVEAAIDVLRESGFVGASARSIAARAGVNSALIFYYFGSVVDLLLAALDVTGERRLSRYREALVGVDDLGELIVLVAQLNREDLDEGHIAVLAALVGGAAAIPELGPKVATRLEPWLRFSEERIASVLEGSPFATLVPASDLAFAICALFLGVEMLSQLGSDSAPVQSLFDAADRVTQLIAPFLGVSR